MSLRINVTTGSAELADSPIQNAILSLAALVAEKQRQGAVPDKPSLEITFMLPGKLDKPPFDGMRMGGFTAEDNTLFFERAVPENILHSGASPRFVAAVIDDMVANAGEFFQDSDIPFDHMGWFRLANDVGRHMNGG